MKKALCALAAVMTALVGGAVPSDAAVVGVVQGLQHYSYPIQVLPVPVGSYIVLSGSAVVGASLESINCAFQGGATEGFVAVLPSGSMNGTCVTPSATLTCSFTYNRIALWMVLNGNCGTQALVGELEWVGLPGSLDAQLGGFIQIG